MDVEYLTLEDLLDLVDALKVGPVRDIGLLDSAAYRPTSTLMGEDLYPSLAPKAAALLESLVRNHSLADGNKRLGWLSTTTFLSLNRMILTMNDDEAYDLVIAVAASRLPLEESAARLASWMTEERTEG